MNHNVVYAVCYCLQSDTGYPGPKDREMSALYLAACNMLPKLLLIISEIPVGKEPR